MAKSFKSLKDPKLHLLDKLPFGKYQNCRIIDLFPDNWEYLKWLVKNTQVKFGQDVLDKITECFSLEESYRHHVEEEAPWIKEAREVEIKDLFWTPSQSKQEWLREKGGYTPKRDYRLSEEDSDPFDDIPF